MMIHGHISLCIVQDRVYRVLQSRTSARCSQFIDTIAEDSVRDRLVKQVYYNLVVHENELETAGDALAVNFNSNRANKLLQLLNFEV